MFSRDVILWAMFVSGVQQGKKKNSLQLLKWKNSFRINCMDVKHNTLYWELILILKGEVCW